jgi:undecaprenyl-diphosphatase
MLLLVGTVPAGAVGLVLEAPLKQLFASPRAAAAFLVANGVMLLGGELLRRRSERAGLSREEQEGDFKEAEQISFRAAAITGVAQALALLPGISRSGVTMTGGLLAGLRHQEAARFSFLLATPIIAAAGLLEVPQLFERPAPLLLFAVAAAVAGAAAFVSARFLIRYFRSGRLDPYGWYCAGLGILGLVLLR